MSKCLPSSGKQVFNFKAASHRLVVLHSHVQNKFCVQALRVVCAAVDIARSVCSLEYLHAIQRMTTGTVQWQRLSQVFCFVFYLRSIYLLKLKPSRLQGVRPGCWW